MYMVGKNWIRPSNLAHALLLVLTCMPLLVGRCVLGRGQPLLGHPFDVADRKRSGGRDELPRRAATSCRNELPQRLIRNADVDFAASSLLELGGCH